MRDGGVLGGLVVTLVGGALLFGGAAALVAVADGSGSSVVTQTVGGSGASSAPATSAAAGGSTVVGGTAAGALPAEVVIGARAYSQFACGACHGAQGEGGVSPTIPALTGAGKEFTATQLRGIIDHGAGVVSDPKQPFMPVWGAVISDAQVDALVAYVRAGLPPVAGIAPLTPPADATPAAAGSILYETYGCVNCHGPNGLGGVPNPGSADTTVPPLVGKDFANEFDAKKMAEIIVSGSVIGKPPTVAMPHWGGVISQADVAALVAYIQSLTP